MDRRTVASVALSVMIAMAGCTEVYVLKTTTRQGVALVGVPPRALIYVDGRMVGTGRSLDRVRLYMKPGIHSIEVRMEGRYPFFWKARVRKGKLVIRRVELHAVVDE